MIDGVPDALVAIAVGFGSGVLSGIFGVGGGITMTPGVQILVGTSPIVALATPLPVILPTASTGAWTYRRAGQIDLRAAAWMVGPGIAAAVVGAALTDVIDTHLLLLVTAVLLAAQSVSILRGRREREPGSGVGGPWAFIAIGTAAGFVSGLLGIGGGLIMVPLLAGWLGMPLKVTLGTSLAAIVVLVIPGTVVHTALGHIDWAVAGLLIVGAVPGARVGATVALGARERTLRLAVGAFLLVIAAAYGVSEAVALLRG